MGSHYNSFRSTVFLLYRSYVRQVRRLPHIYLQQFFRVKVADDIRSLLTTTKFEVRCSKLRRIKQGLHKIEAANSRDKKAFAHILDVAYGRKGRLRWEVMKPLLSNPGTPLPPRIIPAVERSRPPTYSPELAALLTCAHSRKTKPLELSDLHTPPLMPTRADPSSEDARLLGRLSKRREVNIRWRYFTQEWKKILPPLEVSVKDISNSREITSHSADHSIIDQAGIRGVGMQGAGVIDELLALAGPPRKSRTLARKERRTLAGQSTTSHSSQPPTFQSSTLPTRWIQRRYKELLGRLPILTYSHFNSLENRHRTGSYDVSLAASAISPSVRSTKRLAAVDSSDLTWIEAAERQKGSDKQRHKSNATN